MNDHLIIVLLFLAAMGCFIADAIGVATRVNLTALGLAFLTGALLMIST